MIDNKILQTKVIIGGVNKGEPNFDYYMRELAQLSAANNMEVVGRVDQNLERLVAATYFGSGKVAEIGTLAQESGATHLVLNDELSPTQIRNLERETKLQVVDRTELILEIFSNRAKTKQAKLQVALARLQYELPRLHTAENSGLDQQRGSGTGGAGGGGLANRGSGETKLELNRRTLGKQIAMIKEELQEISRSEATRRKERNESALPQVALVGYTNAGKSTTMNSLLQLFGQGEDPEKKAKKQVFEKDMLFATLDTSVRRIDLASNFSFLLSDTVGFISKLPHKLVESFKATLQEVRDADLLIHVVDVSDENHKEMVETTNAVLKELGVLETPTIIAYNKADETVREYPSMDGDDLFYSAKDEQSMQLLSQLITKKLFADYQVRTLRLPLTAGKDLAYLHAKAEILTEDYTSDGVTVEARLSPTDQKRLESFTVNVQE